MYQHLEEAIKYWDHVAPLVKIPKNDEECDELITQLDKLLDIVGGNEEHKLISLVDTLSHLISAYEEKYLQEQKSTGVDALKYLMDAHHLSQADLSEVASQGVMSEILNRKRKLNMRQIKLLAKRFNVSTATFIDD
jgi:HTH-type transcriptional regulator/antitoxin HigA